MRVRLQPGALFGDGYRLLNLAKTCNEPYYRRADLRLGGCGQFETDTGRGRTDRAYAQTSHIGQNIDTQQIGPRGGNRYGSADINKYGIECGNSWRIELFAGNDTNDISGCIVFVVDNALDGSLGSCKHP